MVDQPRGRAALIDQLGALPLHAVVQAWRELHPEPARPTLDRFLVELEMNPSYTTCLTAHELLLKAIPKAMKMRLEG